MPHLAGTCQCGRPIHLPSGARKGYRWTCYRCGKTWTLSGHGSNPVSRKRSLPPRTPLFGNTAETSHPGSTKESFSLLRFVIGLVMVLWLLSMCSV